MNADQMSLKSILDHAVKVGLAVEIPWCAEHDSPYVFHKTFATHPKTPQWAACEDSLNQFMAGKGDHNKHEDVGTCRLEEPARHLVIGTSDE